MARLNVALGALLLLLVAGPPLLRWLTSPEPEAPAAARPEPAVRPEGPAGRAPSEPAVVEPAAPVEAPGGGRAASLAREALTLYRQGRVAEACDRYREALREAPGEESRRNLGSCLARLGRDAYQGDQPRLAAEHYQRAVETYPESPAIWTGLALSHVKAGDLSRADDVLGQARTRFPGDADVLYLLAEVQERQARTAEAVETLRRLLAAHPAHARGRTLLASLEREQRVEGGYWSQESAHFLVRYEGAQGIDLGRSAVDILESAYDSIGRDLSVLPKHKIQVGIYSTQVLGEVIGVPAHYIRGAFDGRKVRLNLAESVAYSNDLSRLVRHEYTHAVVHLATNGRAPIWLHEGLAQVMEPRSAPRYLEASVPRELLTLSGIERLGRTMDPVAFTAGYGLMHVAVEHLVDRGGMSAMRDFLARLGRGEAVPEALRGAYGFGPEEIESRLLAVGGKG